jgi:hypothetical protein
MVALFCPPVSQLRKNMSEPRVNIDITISTIFARTFFITKERIRKNLRRHQNPPLNNVTAANYEDISPFMTS